MDGTGIFGLPYENEQIRIQGLSFIETISKNFDCARDWRPSPLHVIPGSPLALQQRFHDLVVIRQTFQDFLAFTKDAFENQVSYYASERAFHPYGVYPEGSPGAIAGFMREAGLRLNSWRQAKKRIQIASSGLHRELHLTDPFSPLESLQEGLDLIKNSGGRTLSISLGSRTWFHRSWLDYTSETGENGSTHLGSSHGSRLETLRKSLSHGFRRFDRVELQPAPGRWGVIKEMLANLTDVDEVILD